MIDWLQFVCSIRLLWQGERNRQQLMAMKVTADASLVKLLLVLDSKWCTKRLINFPDEILEESTEVACLRKIEGCVGIRTHERQ